MIASIRTSAPGPGLGLAFTASAVIHLAVFLLLLWWTHLFPMQMPVQETYYVDVVNLPVASPRAGDPGHSGSDSRPPAPPAPPAPPSPPASSMSLPTRSQPKPHPVKPQTIPPRAAPARPNETTRTDQDADDFDQRMARLQGKAESHQQEEALERLRNRVTASKGRAGMPGASGTQAGSDYAAFIKSRLTDAFRETISYSTKQPEVVVSLVIAADGRVARRKIDRSSGDRAFELAVMRAIDLASEKFPPPPNRSAFEGVFSFKPQGISNGGKP